MPGAPGTAGNGFHLPQGALKILGRNPTQLAQLRHLIGVGPSQVVGQADRARPGRCP